MLEEEGRFPSGPSSPEAPVPAAESEEAKTAAPAEEKDSSGGSSTDERRPRCDVYGRRVTEANKYLLVRSRPPGPLSGWYVGSWGQFQNQVPGGRLPAEGYNYRKGGTPELDAKALEVWRCPRPSECQRVGTVPYPS